MAVIEITGRCSLEGEIQIQGSKNAALPMLAGTILNKGVSVLHHCPHIKDVYCMIRILEEIGCIIHWEGDSLVVNAACIHSGRIAKDYAQQMRSSIMLLGSMLGRIGHAYLPYPGGCIIGKRPIDLHLCAFEQMGAIITEEEDSVGATMEVVKRGTITLPFPSVGATENVILAAVLGEGITKLIGGAREPEIIVLCNFLNAMGANIYGAGTGKIVIKGTKSLHFVEYDVIADRIVTGTYLLAAAAARGKIFFQNPPLYHLDAVLSIFYRMGGTGMRYGNSFLADGKNCCQPIPYIDTCPYPGFPTDLQSQLMTVLALANGDSCIKENIFEARFKTAAWLSQMGAQIKVIEDKAWISGVKGLKGCTVKADELRGGAALVIAGLTAEGVTIVENREFIERGYEDICRDFRLLGAQIYCKDS